MPKSAAITLWRHEPSRIIVYNGFSFIAHVLDADHHFVNPDWLGKPHAIDTLRAKLAAYDLIYCSVSCDQHVRAVRPAADDRWLFGGPAVLGAKAPSIRNCYRGTMESLLGLPPSTRFTDYWTGHPDLPAGRRVYFACSVGEGCYWNRCLFCDYRAFTPGFNSKRNVAPLLAQLTHAESTSMVHLCVASMTPALLEEVLAAGLGAKFKLVSFCRADPALVDFVRGYRGSLAGLFFSIGVEALSSRAMAVLEKGFDCEAVLELTRCALARGALVEWNIIDNLPFLDDDMAADYERNCQRGRRLAARRPSVFNSGQIVWPNAETAGRFGAYVLLSDGRARSLIRRGTPAYEANLRAGRAISSSGLTLHGEPFGAALVNE